MSRDCGRVGECTYQRKQLDLTLFENKIGMNENVRLGDRIVIRRRRRSNMFLKDILFGHLFIIRDKKQGVCFCYSALLFPRRQ